MMDLWQWLLAWFDGRKPAPVPPAPIRPPTPPPAPVPVPGEPASAALLRLHNAERAKLDLQPLKLDSRLIAAAVGHVVWMAETGQLTHYGRHGTRYGRHGSTFSGRAAEAGYPMRAGGENIAGGYTSPQSVMLGWMGSTGHRRNILSPEFQHVGFGRAGDYWCAVFGLELTEKLTFELLGTFDAPPPLDGR